MTTTGHNHPPPATARQRLEAALDYAIETRRAADAGEFRGTYRAGTSKHAHELAANSLLGLAAIEVDANPGSPLGAATAYLKANLKAEMQANLAEDNEASIAASENLEEANVYVHRMLRDLGIDACLDPKTPTPDYLDCLED